MWLYNFNRQLRLVRLDAIERVEVALRAAINNELAGALRGRFYLGARAFEQLKGFEFSQEKVRRARSQAITHYHERYDDASALPIWAVTEAVTFGTLSRLYPWLAPFPPHPRYGAMR